ncbi:MAG: M24 family metallopeptidase, partial [Chloroflexota bacterium]
DALRTTGPGATFVPGDRIFARLRMRKSAAEIAAIRTAISAAECEPPSNEIRSRTDAVAAMQDAMIGAVRPGLSLRDAYAAATHAASPWSGNDPTFIFQLHGIGLETHEPPRFCSPNEPYFPLPDEGAPDDVPIDSGAVVCLELGMGGLWTEDLFLPTADGAERLTTLPRAILSSNQ